MGHLGDRPGWSRIRPSCLGTKEAKYKTRSKGISKRKISFSNIAFYEGETWRTRKENEEKKKNVNMRVLTEINGDWGPPSES